MKIYTKDTNLNKVLVKKDFNKYKDIKISEKIYDKDKSAYFFIAPVRIGKKLIGFSIIKYNEYVIYETYFRAKLRILLLTFIFIPHSLVTISPGPPKLRQIIGFFASIASRRTKPPESLALGNKNISEFDIIFIVLFRDN